MSTSTDREPCRLCGIQPRTFVCDSWGCYHGGMHDGPAIFGPDHDPSGTGWDAHMLAWDAAYAARAKKAVVPEIDAALDKLADGGNVWNDVNPRELRGEPADWWRTGVCGQCGYNTDDSSIAGPDSKRCFQFHDAPACPAGVRR